MKNQSGFTLVELLVVIAIIGILSSLNIVTLGGVRNKAYDAQIKSDLGQLRVWSMVNFEDGNFSTFNVGEVTPHLVPPACTGVATPGQYNSNVSNTEWVAWANLCDAPTKYFCVDSTGVAVVETGSVPDGMTLCP